MKGGQRLRQAAPVRPSQRRRCRSLLRDRGRPQWTRSRRRGTRRGGGRPRGPRRWEAWRRFDDSQVRLPVGRREIDPGPWHEDVVKHHGHFARGLDDGVAPQVELGSYDLVAFVHPDCKAVDLGILRTLSRLRPLPSGLLPVRGCPARPRSPSAGPAVDAAGGRDKLGAASSCDSGERKGHCTRCGTTQFVCDGAGGCHTSSRDGALSPQ